MGLIGKRGHKGYSLGGYNPNSLKNKAPLRKIIKRLRINTGMFTEDRVLLECGHETNSNGVYRAKCVECKDA